MFLSHTVKACFRTAAQSSPGTAAGKSAPPYPTPKLKCIRHFLFCLWKLSMREINIPEVFCRMLYFSFLQCKFFTRTNTLAKEPAALSGHNSTVLLPPPGSPCPVISATSQSQPSVCSRSLSLPSQVWITATLTFNSTDYHARPSLSHSTFTPAHGPD